MRKYNCIIFDLDGTLLYTLDDIAISVNMALTNFGYKIHDPEEIKTFINNGAYMLIKRSLPANTNDNIIYKVLEYYNDIYTENMAVKTYIYDGISDLIKELHLLKIDLAIVSNKPIIHAKPLSEIYFGKNTFKYVFGTGDNLPTKPSVECIDLALSALKRSKDEILYVGDSYVDVLTAKNSNLISVGVLWGFKGKESFTDNMPDYLVSNAVELKNLILEIGEKK